VSRSHTLAVLSLGLLLALPVVEAASGDAVKLEKLLRKEKLDKVLARCADFVREKGTDPDVREVCAEARYLQLVREFPGGIPRGDLDAHQDIWSGTAAAVETRGMAAQMALEEAGDDEARRREVVASYADTAAASEVVRGFWAAVEAERTIAAVQAFQAEFPGTAEAGLARVLEQDLTFEAAEAVGTSTAWQELLVATPEHRRADEIRGRWMQAIWAEIESIDTPDAWQALLNQHPDHPRLEEAGQRRIDAIWRDSETEGPSALLAFARSYPTDPRTPEAWRRAHEALVTVTLHDDRRATPLPLQAEGVQGPWVGAITDTVRVEVPVPGQDISWRLETSAPGAVEPAEEAWLELLVEGGLPAWRLPDESFSATWTELDPNTYEARLSHALCRTDRAGSAWIVVVDIGGAVTLRYPFQVRERCAAVARQARADVPITVLDRHIRLGWTRAEVELVFPYQAEAEPSVEGGRLVRSCLPGSGADAVCFDFYDDLLVAMDIACWSNEPCFDNQGTYNRVVPDLRRPLRSKGSADTDDGTRITRYAAGHVVATERHRVDPATGTPELRFSLVDQRFLTWIRPQVPAWYEGVVVE